jgi:hypothetical protein
LFILSKKNNFLPFTKKALKYESCYESGENWELLENGLQISQTESIEKARFYETSNKNQVYNHAFLTVEMCMTQCSFNGFPYAGLIDAFSINASFSYFYNIYFLLFHSFF